MNFMLFLRLVYCGFGALAGFNIANTIRPFADVGNERLRNEILSLVGVVGVHAFVVTIETRDTPTFRIFLWKESIG